MTSDERAEAAILERLEAGPAGFLDLVEAAASRLGPRLRSAEGGLHAVLHGLLRAGHVEATGRAPDGGAVYARPAATPPPPARPWDEQLPGPDAPPPSSRRASRVALRVASGASDAADRGRVAADVLAHLAAIGGARGARSFGSANAARDALRRADRGRRRVALALGPAEVARRLVVHELPGFLTAAAVFAAVWIFFLEPRRIPSGSMVPTLHEGDRMLVWKPGARRVPERWAVVTFENAQGDTLVKRVAGLPGDQLQIRGGDVWVDGRVPRKPESVRRALKREVLRAGPFGGAPPAGWTVDPTGPGGWRPSGPIRGAQDRADPAHDVYLDAEAPEGAPVELAIEFDVILGDARVAGAAVLRRDASGVSLVLAGPSGEETVARDAGGAGAERLSLAVVDGFVEAEAGSWRAERALDGERGEARIRVRGPVSSLVVSRDVHYTRDGTLANEHEFLVPPGTVFVLGDASHDSKDSRYPTLGPVPVSRLTGRAVVRIWPPLRVGPIH